MLVYARNSFVSTLKLAALVFAFITLTILPVIVLDYLAVTEQPVLPLFATTQGLIASTLIAICYFWIRGRFVK